MTNFVDEFITENAEKLKTTNGRERLRLLAQFLRLVPEERFDLMSWADSDFQTNECGTAACACGWATVIFPEFQLKKEIFAKEDDEDYEIFQYELVYQDFVNWRAVEEFFNLYTHQCYSLFNKSFYDEPATPTLVSERIDKLLKDIN